MVGEFACMRTKLLLPLWGLGFLASVALIPILAAQAQTDTPVVGEVVAWGYNQRGQTNVPLGLTNVIAIAASSVHNLALTGDGIVHAWGYGYFGETNVPPGLSNVVAIAAAGFYGNPGGYCLALKSDGTVAGWGAMNPLPGDLSNVVALAAGAYYWMALKRDGTVATDCWGATNGVLALGGVPVSNVVAVASGSTHCLALRRDGTVLGWGGNHYGVATGVPSDTNFEGVVTLNGQVLSNVVSIAGGGGHSVALKNDGTVVAWGYNGYGQTNVPSSLSNVVAIAKGGNEATEQVLALKADGTLAVWGGWNSATNVPAGLSNVVAVANGSAHALALVGAGPLGTHARLSGPLWSNNTFSVSLPSQSGRVYFLEHRYLMPNAIWTAAAVTAGNGHVSVLTDFNATNLSRFYRVAQW
jgi:alpha-tubulin suppressor-like RCC1 family protein